MNSKGTILIRSTAKIIYAVSVVFIFLKITLFVVETEIVNTLITFKIFRSTIDDIFSLLTLNACFSGGFTPSAETVC